MKQLMLRESFAEAGLVPLTLAARTATRTWVAGGGRLAVNQHLDSAGGAGRDRR